MLCRPANQMVVMMLKALLFDVDGTLADTERDGHRVAFNAAFKDFGLDWYWDEDLYGKLLAVTGGKERMNFYLDEFRPDYQRPEDLQDMIAEIHKTKTVHYTQMLGEGAIPLRPGVKRLIEEARDAGLRLAVATTTTPENVTALLEHALAPGSTDWFEVIAAGDVVPAKKPAPDIYFYAMEKMNLEAKDCLAFEDSANGIKATHGAKLKTIITVNGYTHDDDFTGAALVLENMGEPGKPFEVLDGNAYGADYLNVELLQRIYAN